MFTRPAAGRGTGMDEDEDRRRFERLVLPHLDAAYNLARWLTRNDHDAEDVVQEAMMRALRYMASCRGDDAKAWLLQIVRNACFTWLKDNRPAERLFLDDEDGESLNEIAAPAVDEPHAVAARNGERRLINDAIAALPAAYRDVLVLREIEDLPYGDIARIAGIPIGTVMSRLARARGLLRQMLYPAGAPALRVVAGRKKAGS
ncbi:MAG TPA: sigma-70 family RNA polymerase sigma factor [Ramlibacter sp.]|nr:sigma-70 family RNA polymerase sigma factor [Ramlibacter sp.]